MDSRTSGLKRCETDSRPSPRSFSEVWPSSQLRQDRHPEIIVRHVGVSRANATQPATGTIDQDCEGRRRTRHDALPRSRAPSCGGEQLLFLEGEPLRKAPGVPSRLPGQFERQQAVALEGWAQLQPQIVEQLAVVNRNDDLAAVLLGKRAQRRRELSDVYVVSLLSAQFQPSSSL